MAETQNIYAKIRAVMKSIGAITKNRKNAQQGYAFRGIDDVYNALQPALVEHGLVIVPKMLERVCEEKESRNGGTLFYVTIKAEFHFMSVDDASGIIVTTFGEAMDSGDKATNKAMSAAYKYAAFQTFCIPTEGDNDADATTHTVASSKPPARWPEFEAMLEDAAELGVTAMVNAFKSGAAECREYAQQHQTAWLEALKATAKRKDGEKGGKA